MAFACAVALTGGIATGKSSAASIFRLLGFALIDADAIAHRLLESHRRQIAALFGSEFVTAEGVDRKRLGALIFSDSLAKAKLESLLHPLIREEIAKESERLDGLGVPYFIDIPLFFETAAYPIAMSVVVYAPKQTQLARLKSRDGLDEHVALQRVESQMDIEEKRRRATLVLDNSGNLKQLQGECERIAAIIKEKGCS